MENNTSTRHIWLISSKNRRGLTWICLHSSTLCDLNFDSGKKKIYAVLRRTQTQSYVINEGRWCFGTIKFVHSKLVILRMDLDKILDMRAKDSGWSPKRFHEDLFTNTLALRVNMRGWDKMWARILSLIANVIRIVTSISSSLCSI